MRRDYPKWGKRSDEELVKVISDYHQCSYNKARDVVGIFSKEQIKAMEKEMDTGG
jgi:hypothetical protein